MYELLNIGRLLYRKTRNFDEFGELESNRQILTFQSKATKQNKCLPTKSTTMQSKINSFASILLKFLLPKFLESGFAKV